MNTGRWHEVKEAALPGANVDALISLRNVKDELCSNAEQNLILKGKQLVIPAKLQHRVAQLAHEGHQGMSNTKSFIRSKVWFSNIDKAVEEEVFQLHFLSDKQTGVPKNHSVCLNFPEALG